MNTQPKSFCGMTTFFPSVGKHSCPLRWWPRGGATGCVRRLKTFTIIVSRAIEKIQEYRRIKMTLFSTHPTLVPLVNKLTRHVDHTDFSEKWNIWAFPYKADFERFFSTKWTLPFNGAYHSLHANNGAILHFAAYPTLFAIQSNGFFLTH